MTELTREEREATRVNNPEWRAEQQRKRALYESRRAGYHNDNPHRTRESIAEMTSAENPGETK